MASEVNLPPEAQSGLDAYATPVPNNVTFQSEAANQERLAEMINRVYDAVMELKKEEQKEEDVAKCKCGTERKPYQSYENHFVCLECGENFKKQTRRSRRRNPLDFLDAQWVPTDYSQFLQVPPAPLPGTAPPTQEPAF